MPSVTMEWESRLGRRLRVRDLYILTTVVNSGSMAKAARRLSMAQPSVSAAIANLEHMLGVRLLDRSPHGVEPTIYADALLKRSIAVFDELKQSVTDVESLADPTTGELRIGCPEMFIATLLVQIIEHFSAKYPQVTVHVQDVPPPAIRHPGLRERAYDLVIGGHHPQAPGDHSLDDLDMHYIVEDQMIIAAGPHSRWASRRKIDLAEIVNEPWMLPPPVSANYNRILDACRQRPRSADAAPRRLLDVHRQPLRRQRTVPCGLPAHGRSLPRAEGASGRTAGAALADRHRHLEEPYAEPGGGALHRLRARGHEVAGGQGGDPSAGHADYAHNGTTARRGGIAAPWLLC
jgi:DNA-binding transcriptional LysR family regulator